MHLIALARRAGLKLDLDKFDALARETPLIANIRPSGAYLMEDFFYAGGLPAVLKQLALGGKLKLGARTVNGSTIGENVEPAKTYNDDVIRPLNNPRRRVRQPRGPARQPRPGRRDHQAARRRGAPQKACRQGRRLRRL